MLYLAEKKPLVGDNPVAVEMVEDAVDCALAARDGKIKRERDHQL